jgi:hypothetical protein
MSKFINFLNKIEKDLDSKKKKIRIKAKIILFSLAILPVLIMFFLLWLYTIFSF